MRWHYGLARYPEPSSEAVTYEWSEIQSGVFSGVFLIGGAVNAAVGGVFLGSDTLGNDRLRMAGPISLLAGLAQIAFGIYIHNAASTLENVGATYSNDPAIPQSRP